MSDLDANRGIKGNAGKHEATLKGLAEKVDFASQRANLDAKPKPKDSCRFKDFYYPTLIQIDPSASSTVIKPSNELINSQHCYILIASQSQIYTYFGSETSNAQRAKTRELNQFVIENFNNGVKNAKVCEIDEKFKSNRFMNDFLSSLKEFEEDSVEKENGFEDGQIGVFYKFQEGQLVEMDVLKGKLEYSVLETDQIYVFDFWTECYVWKGKKANLGLCKQCVELVKTGILSGEERATWTIFKRTSEGMDMKEGLFRDKFSGI